MKKVLIIFFTVVAFSSCEKNNLSIPPEYEMLLGKWESYRFVFDKQYPGFDWDTYFVSEEFTEDSLPYKLVLNLDEHSWEVLSDNTFLCGDKIEGFEIYENGSFYTIYLLKNKKRKFCIFYHSGEISFMISLKTGYFPDYATIYLKRSN